MLGDEKSAKAGEEASLPDARGAGSSPGRAERADGTSSAAAGEPEAPSKASERREPPRDPSVVRRAGPSVEPAAREGPRTGDLVTERAAPAATSRREPKAEEESEGGGILAFFGFARDDTRAKESEAQKVHAQVKRVLDRGFGEHLVLLDNGDLWEEYEPRRIPLEPGDEVTIHRGRFGARRLTGPDGRMTGVQLIDCSDRRERPKCVAIGVTPPTGRD